MPRSSSSWSSGRRRDEAAHREVDPLGLAPRELPVVEVRLLHDLADRPEPRVLHPKAFDERLERAVLPVMAELRTEHVERDALLRGGRPVGEPEGGLRVEEA